MLDITLEEATSEYVGSTKYTTVRAIARAVMNRSKLPKVCKVCGFSHHVEVCHIRGIAKFDKTTKLSVVNSLDNLVYLCPNHLDKGLINLEKECDSEIAS